MKRVLILFTVVVCLAIFVQAQPVIRAASVVNAANNLAPGFPNAGLAPGGMFVLKGRNLGARGTVVANSFPLGTSMGGTSMRITVGGTNVNVLMVYVVGGLTDNQGPFDQLAGIVPSNTPTGNGTITVTFNNQTSAPVPVVILANAFGIFTINQGGTGPGVFTDPNFKVNTLINSTHAGDQLFIWGTGLGAISGSDANAPPVGDLNVPVEVYVGGVKATINYKGRSGCCSGIDQILITIPPGMQGCFVPVMVKIGNVVSNFVSVSIAPSGSVCSDPGGFSVSDLQNANSGMTIGEVSITRLSAKFTIPGAGTLQGNIDFGEGEFRKYNAGGVLGSQRGALGAIDGFPSVGCIVYPFPASDNFFDELLYLPGDSFPRVDVGGALNVNGPQGARQIFRQDRPAGPKYDLPGDQTLGGGLPPVLPLTPEYLVPGNYTVNNGNGSADAGGFSATLTLPTVPATLWTNQDAISNVSRTQDLTLNITPPGNGLVSAIVASSSDGAREAGASLLCAVPSGATSFTVPSYILSVLPPSGTASDLPGARLGFLSVGVALASPGRFQTRGVDVGYFNWGQLVMKNVNFQ